MLLSIRTGADDPEIQRCLGSPDFGQFIKNYKNIKKNTPKMYEKYVENISCWGKDVCPTKY